MKIFAYLIEQVGPRDVSALTEIIESRQLAARYFGPKRSLRLEDRSINGDFLRLNFAFKRSGHGPARFRPDHPLEGFDIDGANDGFGEDTAVVVHVPTNTAVVQYNHHGPKVRGIEHYLFAADLANGIGPAVDGMADEDRCGLRFGVVLTPNAMQKVRNFGLYRKIEFAVAVPGIQQGDLHAGRGLGEVLNAPLPQGVETLQMSIAATNTKGSSLASAPALRWINDLLNLGPNVVSRAVVTGKSTEDDPVDPVDLLEDRVSVERPIRLGHGLRYTIDDRWVALEAAWAELEEGNLLPI